MDYVTEPRRLRRRRRPAPLLLLILAAVVVMGLLAAVVLSLRDRRSQPEPEADPHAGQVYVNDGANMVWLTPHEGFPVSALPQEDFRRDENEDGTPGQRVRYIGADYATRWGVDVSNYQGTIDWSQVAASGVQFAMIRVGYRTQKTGEIVADTNAKYNMQEAQANGIKIGAYFFSTAVTTDEAVQEADWVANYISQYQITYPVAFNCEGFENADSRQYAMTQSERTDMAIAFLNEIYNRGYTPMFYAAKNEMLGDAKWDTSRIEKTYKIWVSQYPSVPYPQTAQSDYTGTHAMWQYTNQGTVAGISKPVDVDIAYFGYAGTADAKSDVTPETVGADAEALMNFSDVNETVTAKQSTNLRNIPSQGSDATVVATLQNGETATRTGVSSSGWSRVSYNGQTLYAVSSYLTTDLGYTAPAANTAAETTTTDGSGSGDGLKTKFTACNDVVTAKIEVNLRTLPSVTNPDAAVVAVLKNGETVTRTGINTDYGWSRVDYNGQTLYCVSSYLTSAQ